MMLEELNLRLFKVSLELNQTYKLTMSHTPNSSIHIGN